VRCDKEKRGKADPRYRRKKKKGRREALRLQNFQKSTHLSSGEDIRKGEEESSSDDTGGKRFSTAFPFSSKGDCVEKANPGSRGGKEKKQPLPYWERHNYRAQLSERRGVKKNRQEKRKLWRRDWEVRDFRNKRGSGGEQNKRHGDIKKEEGKKNPPIARSSLLWGGVEGKKKKRKAPGKKGGNKWEKKCGRLRLEEREGSVLKRIFCQGKALQGGGDNHNEREKRKKRDLPREKTLSSGDNDQEKG